MNDIVIKAIQKINPTAEVSVSDNDINTIVWENGTTPIPKADIQAQLPIVEFDMAMADLRIKRDRLLAASDWTQLPDTTLTNTQKQSWMQYRTELRNITDGLKTVADVNGVSFPVKPN
jgi:hypothetical protein